MKKVTIYDVAREAGCSTATVSLVLNGSNSIKPETREIVHEASKRLKYSPNYFGRGLTMQKTNTIGLVIPNMINPIFSQMVEGIESCINEKEFNLIVKISDMIEEKELLCLQMLQRKKVDGMIVFPTFEKTFSSKIASMIDNVNTVVFCGANSSNNQISSVKCDLKVGAYIAVEHLIKSGRKKIAFLAPTVNEAQSYERLMGYKDVLFVNGIDFNQNLVVNCKTEFEAIYIAAKELMQSQKPDGIFCLYDFAAIPVMRAVSDLGYSIPKDLSIIGYDNINITRFLPISLSTIETHSRETGRIAAEILMDILQNEDSEVRRIILQPELIIRESSDISIN